MAFCKSFVGNIQIYIQIQIYRFGAGLQLGACAGGRVDHRCGCFGFQKLWSLWFLFGMAKHGRVWYGMVWYGMVWSLWFLRQRSKARTRLPTAVHLIFAHFQIFPILKLARAKFVGTLSIVYFVSVEDCKSCLPAAFVDIFAKKVASEGALTPARC